MKLIYSFLFLALTHTCVNAQTLIENKKDEFTGLIIKRTSYEKITSDLAGPFHAYCRISKIGDLILFDLKLLLGVREYFSISKGDKMMFKMKDGSVIEIVSLDTKISASGEGSVGLSYSAAPGVSISYGLSDEIIKSLLAQPIEKIRIYTSKGYLEKELSKKFDENIKGGLRLTSNGH